MRPIGCLALALSGRPARRTRAPEDGKPARSNSQSGLRGTRE